MGIGKVPAHTRAKIWDSALNPVRKLVTSELVNEACKAANYTWRMGLWTPLLTVLACIRKQQTGASARQIEDWIATLGPCKASSRDGKDFCNARGRLPFDVFKNVLQQVGRCVARQAGQSYRSLPVCIVDGTTLRTPNTGRNDDAFGRSENKIRSSRSPIARLLILVCAGCGAVLAASIGGYRTSELELLMKLLSDIPSGTLILADRGFCSYVIFGKIQKSGSHLLTRYNATRRSRKKKSWGRREWLEEWKLPCLSHAAHPDLLLELPTTMQIRVITCVFEKRGYRNWSFKIATTLLDRHAYPADELISLYLQRWNIELDLRTLKAEASMAQLTTKSPDLIRKEIYSILLAHNCTVGIMGESGVEVRRLSPTRARELITIFSERMVEAPTINIPRLYQDLLRLIAQATLDQRERLPQPRSIVQRPSPYPLLMTSREEWRRTHVA